MCLQTQLPSLERPAEQRRQKTPKNSEKRKEKSRDAARCRRGKETEIFTELASALPLPQKTIAQLDKASVMRLTIAFLKTRALCEKGVLRKVKEMGDGSKIDAEMDSSLLKALDGFVVILSMEGDIVYLSDNVSTHLGVSQVEMMGQLLTDYTHPCDHEEARELLSLKCSTDHRFAFLRLKCTLAAKGRNVNLKSATYKVVQVSGEIVHSDGGVDSWFVALASPVPNPANVEFPLDKQTFVSRHSLDMKFTYVDDSICEFLGYGPEELVGQSAYALHHALDAQIVKESFKTLLVKGQVETSRYRFLARGGGYAWVVTQATRITGPKDHKPQCIVCLNYVVSGIETPELILSDLQLLYKKSDAKGSSKNKIEDEKKPRLAVKSSSLPESSHCVPKTVRVNTGRSAPIPPPTPVAATVKIFAPRTEDMNKGFLTFSKEDPEGTILKEEPEDLTRLAPSGGEDCWPLNDPFFPELNDVFDLGQIDSGFEDTSSLLNASGQLDKNNAEGKLLVHKNLVDSLASKSAASLINKLIKTEDGQYVQINDLQKPVFEIRSEPQVKQDAPVGTIISGGGSIFLGGELKGGGTKDQRAIKARCSDGTSFLNVAKTPRLATQKKESTSVPQPSRPVATTASLFTTLGEITSNKPTSVTESLFEPGEDLGIRKPTGQTATFLSPLGDSQVTNSTMDVFTSSEYKTNEPDCEDLHRAPYIPPKDEVLLLRSEDLMWGPQFEGLNSPPEIQASSPSGCEDLPLDENSSSLARLLQDRGTLESLPLESDFKLGIGTNSRQPKFIESGGSFVDPNKVLPGHYINKDALGGSFLQIFNTNSSDPPTSIIQECEEPPPLNKESGGVKRSHSPMVSPPASPKKFCQNTEARSTPLLTPYAPTMQQLLVSKDPIPVPKRGYVGANSDAGDGGGGGGSGGGVGNHSVLLNLLNTRVVPISVTLGNGAPMARALLSTAGCKTPSPLASLNPTGGFPQGLKLVKPGHLNGPRVEAAKNERVLPRRQDPFLLLSPDQTIPNLLDLTQLDYEVNAPTASTNLLQGSDLLTALDQSL
uniref:Hypoxia-inducible factor 1 alpha n=1 Tax=Oratosquilla oratoria TaxID=337810 RepID=D7R4L2_9CRUS|nr:hypoxia-inducible factor 1 alpha [Oratosquilla oratoria]